MKNHIILLLALGLGSVAAESVLIQDGDKKLLLSESNDSGTNHKEGPANNNETEQKNVNNISVESLQKQQQNNDDFVNIVIEESVETTNTEAPFDLQESLLFDIQGNNVMNFDDQYVPMQEEDYFFSDIVNKDPNELMDTASGFVPIPIFRRHKNNRKKYPNMQAKRRYYRRPYTYNPYRRFYFYPYYQYYSPSSLRFY
ncbi:hypothetical protein KGM_206450 [Danaus plexippus plexippus]|uniref:Uncharacterized protein n=1 Tax=Danaus plexippus plexippus TaxID=278856 RepID=A0A212FJA7_DANPL|nr:uncharacterized protein LOC116770441 isoform X2 [Danaus plexippus plexippus]OWR53823.1 hypothetical protein KGM_206450 [Danaus plexippus plexippus]